MQEYIRKASVINGTIFHANPNAQIKSGDILHISILTQSGKEILVYVVTILIFCQKCETIAVSSINT